MIRLPMHLRHLARVALSGRDNAYGVRVRELQSEGRPFYRCEAHYSQLLAVARGACSLEPNLDPPEDPVFDYVVDPGVWKELFKRSGHRMEAWLSAELRGRRLRLGSPSLGLPADTWHAPVMWPDFELLVPCPPLWAVSVSAEALMLAADLARVLALGKWHDPQIDLAYYGKALPLGLASREDGHSLDMLIPVKKELSAI